LQRIIPEKRTIILSSEKSSKGNQTMNLQRTPCRHKPLAPAIQRCCDARNSALREINANQPPALEQLDKNDPAYSSLKYALKLLHEQYDADARERTEAAYCFAMPDPSTRQGVKDFIACVLHGMTINVFSNNKASMLLTGARIALAGTKHCPPPGAQKAKTFSQAENEDQPVA
jgi:hypothetical protein